MQIPCNNSKYLLHCQCKKNQLLSMHYNNLKDFLKLSSLFADANQMTGFYMERNTGIKWVI